MWAQDTDINIYRIHLLRASRISQLKREKSREGVEMGNVGGEDWEKKDEKKTASRESYGTLFTVFAIVKAANIYVIFKRTRVLGVTRVLSASEKNVANRWKIDFVMIRRRATIQ